MQGRVGRIVRYEVLNEPDFLRMINFCLLRKFITVLFIVLSLFTYKEGLAQVRLSSLELHPPNDWLSYSFPFVYANKKIVADKINKHLQSSLLDNDNILTDTNTVFNNIRYIRYINEDSTGQSGYTSIAYTAESNNTKILSLSFKIESMGAYPENHYQYFNFYSRTRDIITAQNLFIPKGIEEIKKLLLKERKKRITEWINEMDTMYNSRDDSAWISERFADCNKDAGENDFIIKKGQVVFLERILFPACRPTLRYRP